MHEEQSKEAQSIDDKNQVKYQQIGKLVVSEPILKLIIAKSSSIAQLKEQQYNQKIPLLHLKHTAWHDPRLFHLPYLQPKRDVNQQH